MLKKFSFLLACVLAVFSTFFLGCAKTDKITCYVIDCTYKDGIVTGSEEVTFYNNSANAFKELKFNLFANAFGKNSKHKPITEQRKSESYYAGNSYGGILIKSVSEKGKDLEFNICGEDENILSVNLDSEVFPDESVTVKIEFETTLAKVIARTGITPDTVNLTSFYPILCGISDGAFYECVYYANGDPFYSDVANYTINFSCEEKYVVASSGNVIKEEKSDGIKCVTYQMKNTRSFAFVLSEKFESITDNSTGVAVTYYYYNDEMPQKSLQTAIDSLNFFSDKFGDYIYSSYSVVQTPFPQGGMEFPALVMISDDLEDRAYREVIIHETAHQWWQTAVGNNEIEYGFLDEGLAEYSVVLFYEAHPDYGYERKTLIDSTERTYKTFCSVSDKIFGKVDTTMLRSLKDFESEYEYVNIAYVKPCIMYEYLRQTIGDRRFFAALSNYYNDYKYKNAVPDDLVSEFEGVGADTNGFFKSFFEGKVII